MSKGTPYDEATLQAVQGQIDQLNTPTVQDLLQDLETTCTHPTPNDVPNVNRRLRIHVPTPEGLGRAWEWVKLLKT
jgi:hypothetical protein